MRTKFILLLVTFLCLISCQSSPKEKSSENQGITEYNARFRNGEYGYDLEFLKKYLKVVELVNESSRLIVIPEYQGRVMTSSSSGMNGYSNGWINHNLIASLKVLDDFNPVGGEERIWLGPEGGQYSLYFESGASFKSGKWIVPAAFDREPFKVDSLNPVSVILSRKAELKNYSGTVFDIKITRKVTLLNRSQINDIIKIKYNKSIKAVAYQSDNKLENIGDNSWNREKGALSIWMLTMLNASPYVTVVFPYKKGDYGKIVKDNYLGEIPGNRLNIGESAVFFLTDAKFRSKIGMSPQRALPFMGSYDEKNNILSIVEYQLPPDNKEYVNSALEIQEHPFSGDVINSYNDGPKKDGTQMGQYYELEDSSPAAFLKPGEQMVHTQRIYHFQGREKDLNALAISMLNVSIKEIKNAFEK